MTESQIQEILDHPLTFITAVNQAGRNVMKKMGRKIWVKYESSDCFYPEIQNQLLIYIHSGSADITLNEIGFLHEYFYEQNKRLHIVLEIKEIPSMGNRFFVHVLITSLKINSSNVNLEDFFD